MLERDGRRDITVLCVWGHAELGLGGGALWAGTTRRFLFGAMDGSPLISPWCRLTVLG